MSSRRLFPLKTILITCLVLFSGSLYAAPAKMDKPIVVKPAAAAEAEKAILPKAARMLELKQIATDANTVSALMGAELALQNGDINTALSAYVYLFNQTNRPEIAQRGMQIALDTGNYPVAQAFYRKWQTIEPEPSFAQKQMRWEQQVALGQAQAALAELPEIMAQADDDQRSRLFLYTAQLALTNPSGAQSGVSTVHKLALRYPRLQEAAVADTLYAALDKRDRDAVKALQRLASLDTDINSATLITLNLLSRSAPEVLEQFFRKTNTDNLPEIWQTLRIETLLRANKNDEAYALVLKQLDKSPSVELYTQAGYLALLKKEPLDTALALFDKAYNLGNRQQQSRTALFAAMGSLQSSNADIVRYWTDKIHDGDLDFDKNVLLALIANDQKQWPTLKKQLDLLEKLPEQQGLFFNQDNINNLRNEYLARALPPAQAEQRISEMLARAQSAMPINQKELSSLYYARGLLYADTLREPHKAAADLEQYVRLNPDSAEAFNSLGYTLLSIPERLDEGMQWIEKAHQKMPDSAAIQDSLGWAYFLKGKPKKALPYLQSAFTKMNEAEIAAHLGEVLWTLGKKEEARAVWLKGWEKESTQHTLQQTLKKYGITFPSTPPQRDAPKP